MEVKVRQIQTINKKQMFNVKIVDYGNNLLTAIVGVYSIRSIHIKLRRVSLLFSLKDMLLFKQEGIQSSPMVCVTQEIRVNHNYPFWL